jgi:phage terminase large subunit-like protein
VSASLAESLASLPDSEVANILADLTDEEAEALEYDWRWWGRPEQIAPDGDWRVWLALAGRGFGKTEAGAQWIRERVAAGARSIAIVAETQKDLEEVMVPRIISVHPEHMRPKVRYRPVRIVWPNGAQALGYNGTEPDQLRGPEFDTAWCDELAKWRYARETWDMLQFTMRRGDDPRIFVSTTPRPIAIIKEMIADTSTAITRGSTLDNRKNLAQAFIDTIVRKYEGTRLGRQELEAEILDDMPGALWSRAVIDETRVRDYPPLKRVAIAIDPPVTSGDSADECGIIAAGIDEHGTGFVIGDRSSQGDKPSEWARRAVQAYEMFDGDCIVAEVNNGGEMIEEIIRQVAPNIPVKSVRATRGKFTRAEPVAALYEQRRVHHVGSFPKLEDQMCAMTPDFDPAKAGYSPDRLDAMVWAMTELMTGYRSEPRIRSF